MSMEDIRERLARMEERESAIQETLDRLDHQLFGNGQPGLIADILRRLAFLETKFWLAFGGTVTLIWIIEKFWLR